MKKTIEEQIPVPKGYKLSPMFPMSVNPVHVGVYPIQLKDRLNIFYSYWNGSDWSVLGLVAPDRAKATACPSPAIGRGRGEGWYGFVKPGTCAHCGQRLRDHNLMHRCLRRNSHGYSIGVLDTQWDEIK